MVESQSEDQDLRPDFYLLKEMAKVTNGKFLTANEFSNDILKEFEKGSKEQTGRKILLWTSPWIFGLIVILLIAEWFLRKRRGLP